jgi:hypothetical protein
MRACVTEGCGRNSYKDRVCWTCRRHENKDKACATEGCERKPGNYKQCRACRLPTSVKRCGRCGMEAWHGQGQSACSICHAWYSLCNNRRGLKNSFTEFEFLCLLHEADKCPDTGHVFDDCSPDRMLRKSPDRIDNSKGYEPGNVRVTTWRANCDRGTTPIDEWLPMAAERYKAFKK